MKRYIIPLLGLVVFTIACSSLEPARVSEASFAVSEDNVGERDSTILAMVAPYKSAMAAEMNEVIGETEVTLRKGRPESALGNMVADILFAQAEKRLGQSVDFALSNSGGLRIPEIAAGPITRGKIYELLPFDNRLVVVTLSGKTVAQLADHMASQGGWPVSKSFRMVIEEGKAKEVRINGQRIDPEKEYQVAMPDYVANGGDSSSFLLDLPQNDTGVFMRDVVIEYIKEKTAAGEPLRFPVDGRIKRIP